MSNPSAWTSSARPCTASPPSRPRPCNLRPLSRGHIRLKSADPFQAPAIQPNYLSDPTDRRVAVEAIKLVRKIVTGSKAFAPYRPEEFKPGAQITSDADLARAAGDIGTTIFHPVGTCRMGDDPMAVVDTRLRLRGLQGLRIADASIMPTITSGNTNSPTIMIAEKAADLILQDHAEAVEPAGGVGAPSSA